MSGLASYLANKFLDCLVNAVGFNVTGVWVQLHTGDPGAAGTANVAGNNTRKTMAFAAAAAGSKATNADITWTGVSTSETYTHVSLWDAAAAGNYLWSGPLTASKAVNAGDTFTLTSGQVSVGLTGLA